MGQGFFGLGIRVWDYWHDKLVACARIRFVHTHLRGLIAFPSQQTEAQTLEMTEEKNTDEIYVVVKIGDP